MFYLIIMVLLTSMITTSMYWMQQLAAEQRQVSYFIQAQQDKEALLNTLTYSISNLLEKVPLQQLIFPWEDSIMHESNIIEYKAKDPNTIFITIHTPTEIILKAEVLVEYLSNNKKRCTLLLIP